jgi:hypothetical protein
MLEHAKSISCLPTEACTARKPNVRGSNVPYNVKAIDKTTRKLFKLTAKAILDGKTTRSKNAIHPLRSEPEPEQKKPLTQIAHIIKQEASPLLWPPPDYTLWNGDVETFLAQTPESPLLISSSPPSHNIEGYKRSSLQLPNGRRINRPSAEYKTWSLCGSGNFATTQTVL